MDTKKTIEKPNKKITIDIIASELGVSKTTVSRAISGKGRISKETRERVLEHIKKYNYQPNSIAKSLAESKTFNIGVVMPSDPMVSEIPFFQKALMGICQTSSGYDYDVIVTMISENDITQLKRIINNKKVDGIILTRTLVDDLSAKFLKQNNLPFVVLGSLDDDEIVQIDNDHYKACKELTSMIIMQGINNIALIGNNIRHVVSQNRYLGFKDALEVNNIQIDDDFIKLDCDNKILIEKAVLELMEKKVECIFCMDDLICSSVISWLDANDFKIPNDVKVVSFYNSSFLENHNPPITSLVFDVEELGIQSCKTLLELIEKKTVVQKKLLDFEIVFKQSTKIF